MRHLAMVTRKHNSFFFSKKTNKSYLHKAFKPITNIAAKKCL